MIAYSTAKVFLSVNVAGGNPSHFGAYICSYWLGESFLVNVAQSISKIMSVLACVGQAMRVFEVFISFALLILFSLNDAKIKNITFIHIFVFCLFRVLKMSYFVYMHFF